MWWTYEYKNFEGAPELTRKSKTVGNLSSWPMWLLCGGLFLGSIFSALLTSIGISEDPAMIIGIVGAAALSRSVLKSWRNKTNEKLQQQYIAKLNVMRDTNPAEYYRIIQVLQSKQR